MALIPSLNPYGSNTIATGEIVQAPHVYQFVYAFAGLEAYNIFLSGSLNVTGSTILSGSVNIKGLSFQSQSRVLGIDINGNVVIMSTSSLTPSGVIGSGVDHYLALWSGSQFITASLVYQNPTSNNLGIGTITPSQSLTVSGTFGLNGLSSTTSSFVLGIDPITGAVSITQVATLTGSFSSSLVTPAGVDWDIQLKSGSQLAVAALGKGNYHYNQGAWTFGVRNLLGGPIGSWSFAEGSGSTATGFASHVEGILNQSNGIASHAEGEYTIASGEASHAEGNNTEASGSASHAQGYQTKAYGDNSFAAGNYTVASGSDQTVIGKFNTLNNLNDIFIIGSGSNSSSRLDLATFGNQIKFNRNTQITGLLRVTGSAMISSSIYVTGSTFISGGVNILGTPTADQPQVLTLDSNGNLVLMNTSSIFPFAPSSSGITGNGIDGYIAVFNSTGSIVTGSIIYNDKTNQRLGVGTIIPTDTLTVSGSTGITGSLKVTGSIDLKTLLNISGSTNVTGSVNLLGPSLIPQAQIIAIDSNGNLTLMNTSSIYPFSSSSLGGPSGSDWDVQLKLGNQFAVAETGTGSYNSNTGGWTFGKRGLLSSSRAVGSWSFVENKDNIATGNYSSAKGYQTFAGDNSDSVEGYNTSTVNNTLSSLNLNFHYSSSLNKFISVQPGNYVSQLNTLGFNNTNLRKWYYNDFDSLYIEIYNTSSSFNGTFTELYISSGSAGNDDLNGNGIIYFQLYNSTVKGSPLANHAEGEGTIASGDASHAEGKYSISNAEGSHAEGLNTLSSGTGSHSEGRNTIASGDESHAEGSNTQATGISAHAEGYSTIANGDFSHAEGYYNTAQTDYSHVEGKLNFSIGTGSHTEGLQNTALGSYSHVEGYININSKSYSHVEGVRNYILGDVSHGKGVNNYIGSSDSGSTVEGNLNIIGLLNFYPSNLDVINFTFYYYNPFNRSLFLFSDATSIFTVGQKILWYHSDLDINYYSEIESLTYDSGAGQTQCVITFDPTNSTPDSGGGIIYKYPGIFYGDIITSFNHVEGSNNEVKGYYNHIEGYFNKSTGSYNHIEGQLNSASGNFGHVEGFQNYIIGDYSHAEGYQTSASINYSHAEGFQSKSTGVAAHAEGYLSNASGSYSHAEGENGLASGQNSHVEGSNNIASGIGSHAEGSGSMATDPYSHAEGLNTKALSPNAHAEGRGTYAEAFGKGDAAHAEGYFTSASGVAAHAEGYFTKALGIASHAEGYSTTASGHYSHAEGSGSVAFASASHAAGIFTVASGSGQTVVGSYNRQNNTTSLFTIGNGTSNASRSDLLNASGSTVSITGSLFVNGVQINGNAATTGSGVLWTINSFRSGSYGNYQGLNFGTGITASFTMPASGLFNVGDKIIMDIVLNPSGSTVLAGDGLYMYFHGSTTTSTNRIMYYDNSLPFPLTSGSYLVWHSETVFETTSKARTNGFVEIISGSTYPVGGIGQEAITAFANSYGKIMYSQENNINAASIPGFFFEFGNLNSPCGALLRELTLTYIKHI